jgi:hypothetical protein
LSERPEKVCLNCNTELSGRYCHKCGQANIEPKENFWHLTVHFFEDLTHFDGKFFSTIKYLLFKPGYLTEEYIKGRRASYINPIRMYLFISAAFFLVYMSFFASQANLVRETRTNAPSDTSAARRSLHNVRLFLDSTEGAVAAEPNVSYSISSAETVKEYDSLQAALPVTERATGIERYFARKMIALNEKYRDRPGELKPRLTEAFFHSLPYMLFLSVPLIALILWLLYVRRRQYYYVSHIIFVLHYYCTVFILLLVRFALEAIPHWGKYLAVIPVIALVFYLYKAMRRFYQQRRLKTVVKFVLLASIGSVLISLLTFVFLVKSLMDIAV